MTMFLAATKKKAQLGATGGGPPPEELTPAESLALTSNKGPKIDGIQGGCASSPTDAEMRAAFVEGTALSTTVPPLHGDSPSVNLADYEHVCSISNGGTNHFIGTPGSCSRALRRPCKSQNPQ